MLEQREDLRQLYTTLFEKKPANADNDLDIEQAYAAHSVKMQLNMFEEAEELPSLPLVVKQYKRRKIFAGMAVAVLGLCIGCASYLFFNKPSEQVVKNNEVATRKGSKSKIILPDSSVVWLNADSRLVYPGDFHGKTREVQLTGEAFFEVTKDPHRPFIIHTNTVDVKVLGTVFNVRSYPEETTTETSLITGEVEVTVLNQDKKVILKPNEKLIVPNKIDTTNYGSVSQRRKEGRAVNQPLLTVDKIHFKEEDSLYTETSWVDNKLDFDGEPLNRLTSKIERWYNVEIVINNEKLKSTRFTAMFDNESLKEVMEALSTSYSFKYKMEGAKVTIY